MAPGWNEAASYEPVNLRSAPGSDVARTRPSIAPYAATDPPRSTPPRSSARRDRSVLLGLTGRATMCHTAMGIDATAAPTWTRIRSTPRRRPVAWMTPVTTAVTTRRARAIDGHEAGPRLLNPRTEIADFHGPSRTMATPATPCPIATHRPHPAPIANASAPVRGTTPSSTSRARLVLRPAGKRCSPTGRAYDGRRDRGRSAMESMT
jgi:hypothetical protein